MNRALSSRTRLEAAYDALRDALALVEIRLLDHLIIGDGCCTSLAEKGLI